MKFVKLPEDEAIPFNFHYLQKEPKVLSKILYLSKTDEYNAIGRVGVYHKPNNILPIREEQQ